MTTATPKTTAVRDLFALPDRIHKGDFVLQLTEGIQHPEQTAADYVVTPSLVGAFDTALSLISDALSDGRSRASYVRGSFGSGKSHFMALLSLLIGGSDAAWRIAELHALRPRHAFVGTKRLLQLHYHMVGKRSIEEAVFTGYVERVRRDHPKAPIPALFADEQLFADALHMLGELGDATFFAPMNAEVADDGSWGDIGSEARWTRDRFDAASNSTDPKMREELFSALVKTRFKAYATEGRAFVDIDTGLAVMARHAKDLGYDGIVLFLDELILWLSHRASEIGWLHGEVQKMVKLVESQEASRAIPIISFIARQRSIVEMVGKDYAGAESARLNDSLKHWESRYNDILLEDNNLPLILEKRLLRPKSDEATKGLDAAFERMRQSAGASWQTMLGQQDAVAFRRLYPFSPALVEALVALSNSLQRERTAIKLLMELLVEHINDVEVGEVVRVGDLFDVLAGGEEPADGVMKARFGAAKQAYRCSFLPLIQEQNLTTTADRCQRLRPGHPTRIGCSNCGERQCRTDNRLIKTLLIAALVSEVPALKNMTASRLVQLNHGTLKVPIPGTEANLVAQRLRGWASVIGQLHLGTQPDPTVDVQIEGVDLNPILDRARDADSDGARQVLIRNLLFQALGLDLVHDSGKDVKVEWRGTDRVGFIRFGNIRTMGPDALKCSDDHDWRLVVDYPFDRDGHGVTDDTETVQRFMDETGGSWTLAWMPTFFSATVLKLLGDLVILEHILENREAARKYVSHLSVENQTRALNDLESLRGQKETRILGALEAAYGVAQERDGDLDPMQRIERHLVALKPGVDIRTSLAPNLKDARDAYIPALLDARYPRHPRFDEHKLTPKRVERLVETFGKIVDEADKRIAADKEIAAEVTHTLGELGLARATEGSVHLVEDRLLQELENTRRRLSSEHPTVAEVRQWIDESGKMGLRPEALDLIVRCYARWAARTLVHFGKPFEAKAGATIPDEVMLERPDLPGHAEWEKALSLAGTVFGITLGNSRALHGDNLKKFEAELEKKLGVLGACTNLVKDLADWLPELGDTAGSERLRTAQSAEQICSALFAKRGVDQVRALAKYDPVTSASAVKASILTAQATHETLSSPLTMKIFRGVAAKQSLPGATELLEQVARALRDDELNLALAPRIADLARQGMDLISPAPSPPPPGEETVLEYRASAVGKADVAAKVKDLTEQLQAAMQKAGENVRIEGSIRVVRTRK